MNTRRWLSLTAFTLVLAGAITGLVLTRARAVPVQAAPAPVPVTGKAKGKTNGKAPAPSPERLVDESPLLTARRLLPLAVSPAEKLLVRQAERLANHEVDLAFTDALRKAQEEPPPATPQTQELISHRNGAEAALEKDRLRITELTRKLAAAVTRDKDALEDQLDVAKAEEELDQDELEQANEALERAGGDPQARIQRLKAAHTATEATASAPAVQAPQDRNASLLARLLQLKEDHEKVLILRQAQTQALDKGHTMAERRIDFAKRVEKEGADRVTAKSQAAGFSHADKVEGQSSREVAQATLKSLQHFMSSQRRLANFGRRIQDQGELTEVYDTWISLAEREQQASLHEALKWLLAILAVLLTVFLAGQYFEHLLNRLMQGPDRVGRMPKMVRFATEAVGAVSVLCLLFGLPSQMTTLFGLAGAGLTVALKDFIMAFFGWFILVGRNGIHVGDWVEIKGVGGEVVEIGLLRTLLMETGNWSDASRPTGRVVSFVNSFAMEGHFFNFSTKGQWMWDELRVLVPSGQAPYPFIEAIRTLVANTTLADAALAQQEWTRTGRKSRAQAVSAQPGVDVVPTGQGFEIRVRYITRAYERHSTQQTLNRALMELLLNAPAGSPE